MGTLVSTLSPSGNVGAKFDPPWHAELKSREPLVASRFLRSYEVSIEGRAYILKALTKPEERTKTVDQRGKPLDLSAYALLCSYYREVVLRQCPRTIPYMSELETRTHAFLLRPMVDQTLADYLFQNQWISDSHRLLYSLQLIEAVVELHRAGLVHGDVKISNFLITNTNEIFLTDLAPFKPHQVSMLTPDVLSYFFTDTIAPERILTAEDERLTEVIPTPEADVFGLGCVILELWTLQKPFDLPALFEYKDSDVDEITQIRTELESYLLRISHDGLRELVRHMIHVSPENRVNLATLNLTQILTPSECIAHDLISASHLLSNAVNLDDIISVSGALFDGLCDLLKNASPAQRESLLACYFCTRRGMSESGANAEMTTLQSSIDFNTSSQGPKHQMPISSSLIFNAVSPGSKSRHLSSTVMLHDGKLDYSTLPVICSSNVTIPFPGLSALDETLFKDITTCSCVHASIQAGHTAKLSWDCTCFGPFRRCLLVETLQVASYHLSYKLMRIMQRGSFVSMDSYKRGIVLVCGLALFLDDSYVSHLVRMAYRLYRLWPMYEALNGVLYLLNLLTTPDDEIYYISLLLLGETVLPTFQHSNFRMSLRTIRNALQTPRLNVDDIKNICISLLYSVPTDKEPRYLSHHANLMRALPLLVQTTARLARGNPVFKYATEAIILGNPYSFFNTIFGKSAALCKRDLVPLYIMAENYPIILSLLPAVETHLLVFLQTRSIAELLDTASANALACLLKTMLDSAPHHKCQILAALEKSAYFQTYLRIYDSSSTILAVLLANIQYISTRMFPIIMHRVFSTVLLPVVHLGMMNTFWLPPFSLTACIFRSLLSSLCMDTTTVNVMLLLKFNDELVRYFKTRVLNNLLHAIEVLGANFRNFIGPNGHLQFGRSSVIVEKQKACLSAIFSQVLVIFQPIADLVPVLYPTISPLVRTAKNVKDTGINAQGTEGTAEGCTSYNRLFETVVNFTIYDCYSVDTLQQKAYSIGALLAKLSCTLAKVTYAVLSSFDALSPSAQQILSSCYDYRSIMEYQTLNKELDTLRQSLQTGSLLISDMEGEGSKVSRHGAGRRFSTTSEGKKQDELVSGTYLSGDIAITFYTTWETLESPDNAGARALLELIHGPFNHPPSAVTTFETAIPAHNLEVYPYEKLITPLTRHLTAWNRSSLLFTYHEKLADFFVYNSVLDYSWSSLLKQSSLPVGLMPTAATELLNSCLIVAPGTHSLPTAKSVIEYAHKKVKNSALVKTESRLADLTTGIAILHLDTTFLLSKSFVQSLGATLQTVVEYVTVQNASKGDLILHSKTIQGMQSANSVCNHSTKIQMQLSKLLLEHSVAYALSKTGYCMLCDSHGPTTTGSCYDAHILSELYPRLSYDFETGTRGQLRRIAASSELLILLDNNDYLHFYLSPLLDTMRFLTTRLTKLATSLSINVEFQDNADKPIQDMHISNDFVMNITDSAFEYLSSGIMTLPVASLYVSGLPISNVKVLEESSQKLILGLVSTQFCSIVRVSIDKDALLNAYVQRIVLGSNEVEAKGLPLLRLAIRGNGLMISRIIKGKREEVDFSALDPLAPKHLDRNTLQYIAPYTDTQTFDALIHDVINDSAMPTSRTGIHQYSLYQPREQYIYRESLERVPNRLAEIASVVVRTHQKGLRITNTLRYLSTTAIKKLLAVEDEYVVTSQHIYDLTTRTLLYSLPEGSILKVIPYSGTREGCCVLTSSLQLMLFHSDYEANLNARQLTLNQVVTISCSAALLTKSVHFAALSRSSDNGNIEIQLLVGSPNSISIHVITDDGITEEYSMKLLGAGSQHVTSLLATSNGFVVGTNTGTILLVQQRSGDFQTSVLSGSARILGSAISLITTDQPVVDLLQLSSHVIIASLLNGKTICIK
ncbi:Kinase, VPS15 [Giardia muris]|uniref:Kinase, VPS15 n=1 Tax=Giardia muris TaxID=5742 RepID=A0A4Z1SXB2_GIAMU|nr:Kinase, VPS15 [Giardia muris]|eukprot:TNJ28168.1 Kinase, VPS15 [Giardia muris]